MFREKTQDINYTEPKPVPQDSPLSSEPEAHLGASFAGVVQGPIHSLPEDILLEMFTHFADQCFSKLFSAIWLCNVCSRWRSVLQSRPSWWNDIRFSVDDPVSVLLAQKFMRRAGNISLQISMKGYDASTNPIIGGKGTPANKSKSASALTPFIERAHTLSIYGETLAAVLPFVEESRLEKLIVLRWRSERSPVTSNTRLPFLRELHLSKSRTELRSFFPTTLPLNQITSLHFENEVTLPQIAVCLGNLPELQFLHLDHCTSIPSHHSDFKLDIVCSNLTALDLSTTTDTRIINWMDIYVQCPSILNLALPNLNYISNLPRNSKWRNGLLRQIISLKLASEYGIGTPGADWTPMEMLEVVELDMDEHGFLSGISTHIEWQRLTRQLESRSLRVCKLVDGVLWDKDDPLAIRAFVAK